MRLFSAAALAVVIALVASPSPLSAGVNAPLQPPPPGWPTERYATYVDRCAAVDLVVFEFFKGKKIFVTDRAWIEAFQAALKADQAKPTAYCFCISEPTTKLYAKDRPVCSFEISHERTIRFDAGNFVIPAESYTTLLKLWAVALKTEGFVPPKKAPPHAGPKRVELKP
jgi:hypothetical protein